MEGRIPGRSPRERSVLVGNAPGVDREQDLASSPAQHVHDLHQVPDVVRLPQHGEGPIVVDRSRTGRQDDDRNVVAAPPGGCLPSAASAWRTSSIVHAKPRVKERKRRLPEPALLVLSLRYPVFRFRQHRAPGQSLPNRGGMRTSVAEEGCMRRALVVLLVCACARTAADPVAAGNGEVSDAGAGDRGDAGSTTSPIDAGLPDAARAASRCRRR